LKSGKAAGKTVVKNRFWKAPGFFSSGDAEDFLRTRERYCVGACSRYLNMKANYWYTQGGFLIHSRRILFPVFHFEEEPRRLPLPRRLEKIVAKEGIHAVQGLVKDVELLETALFGGAFSAATLSAGAFSGGGFPGPSEIIDYDLMELDYAPETRGPAGRIPNLSGLVLRIPGPKDINDLFPLQAGYEQEEVLPRAAVFNPAACLLNLQKIVSGGLVLAAEYEGRVVGKINVNAESFTRFQIGGVYVEPAYRKRGIGGALTAEFIRLFGTKGKGFTLFVKKQNAAARRIYDRTGFKKLADYRIDYFT
jgi:GNAT superfamily N-acetyltransferase